MYIDKIINEKLEGIDLKELAKKLEDNSNKSVYTILSSFIESKTIFNWIQDGYDELSYTKTNFFIHFCKELNIDDELVQSTLEELKEYKTERVELKKSYIKVNTSVKKLTGPKAMAFSQARIAVDVDAVVLKTLEQKLDYISQMVKEHYKKHNGSFIIIGDILGYSFEYKNHTHRFSIDGKLIEEV